jgi:hypothetical protein
LAVDSTASFVRRLAARILGPLRRRPPRLVAGLPEGLSQTVLDAVCREHLRAGLASVSHHHLSAWKASGSYRLYLRLTDGKQRTLIFKRADYSASQIPALTDFPARPGLPEYHVYAHGAEILGASLPAVYRCEVVVPGERYDYVLEDLGDRYRVAAGLDDMLESARQLPALHATIGRFVDASGTEGLVRFDGDFWERLVAYAARSLDRWFEREPGDAVGTLRKRWTQLNEVRGEIAAAMGPAVPIHGDYNVSNILVRTGRADRLKILDWEWAGIGWPHADLASLAKGSDEATERRLVEVYAAAEGRRSVDEHWRLYQWSQLERGVLDAAFLAAQGLDATHASKLDLAWCVDNSARIVLDKLGHLS